MLIQQGPEHRQNDTDSETWEKDNSPKADSNNELHASDVIKKNNGSNYRLEVEKAEEERRISDTNNSTSPIVCCCTDDDGSHGVPSTHSSDADDDVSFVQIDTEEEEEEEEEQVVKAGGWMTNLPVSSVEHETNNGQVLPSLDKTTFGQVHVSNSSNVRVGNTTFYKGPVTIKQFVYTNSATKSNNDNDIANGRISDANSNEERSFNSDSANPILPIYRDYDKVLKWLWTWRCAALLSVIALILITIIVVVSVLMIGKNDKLPPLGPATDPDDILTEDVRLVSRVDWGAQPPEHPPSPLVVNPPPYVIISHTASEPCATQAQCSKRVRIAQTMHIEGNGWDDIGYNFLVGGDGLGYVGRGWDVEGAHTFNYNKKSIGISFIGTFNTIEPPRRQLHAMIKLIELGVKEGKIAADYKLMGHRQLTETLSPGDALYRIIQTLPHWSAKP